jgi:putative ABC transport system permease protein
MCWLPAVLKKKKKELIIANAFKYTAIGNFLQLQYNQENGKYIFLIYFWLLKNTINIITHAFAMAIQELSMNRFRTFLSLFGITIGIFCIIGVLSSINSLDRNIKKDLNTIGNNTIFISKWQWGVAGNSDYPWWKYVQRPSVNINDMQLLKEQSAHTAFLCYATSESSALELNGKILSPVNFYGTTSDFINIQNVTVGTGRYITNQEFSSGNNVCLIGYENAIKLFGRPENAIQQQIKIKGHSFIIAGVFKKYGRNILDGWDYDNCALIPFNYYNRYFRSRRTEPFIMAKPVAHISIPDYISELRVAMRGIRRIQPGGEENFSLNDINIFSDRISSITKYVQLGGSVIALFSLIVGAFGIANIMFVTVKERTAVIGLKKAIGAKQSTIRMEFLMESAFLCIIGGFIGLLFLYIATIFLSKVFHFEIIISVTEVLLTILLCTVIGVLSGFIPAKQAAKMNAVTALRNN